MTTRPVAADFDHHSRQFARDPAGVWRRLRYQAPIAYSERYGGFWIVTRYEDVADVDRNTHRFSTADDPFGSGAGGLGVTIPPSPVRFGFFELDPPQHPQQRRLYSPWFGPRAIEKLKSPWRKIAAQVIDGVVDRGQADLVLDVIDPIVGQIMCDFVGLPPEDRQRYTGPFRRAVVVNRGSSEFEAVERELQWVIEALRDHVADRRKRPRGDLISYAVSTEIDDVPLPEEDVVLNLFLIVSGGAETTAGLISNTLMHLNRDRDLRARLIAEPELIQQALEEFNRYYTPITALARTVKEDCEFRGQRLERGERILLAYGAANRDETVFDDPDTVIVDRFPNRHLSFGVGPHRCLGSNFARTEALVIVEEVLRRMPDYRIDEGRAQPFENVGITNSYGSLPAVFTPTTRLKEGVAG